MSISFVSLPTDIIYNILTYNRHFIIKNGKLITIKRLDMSKYNLDISPRVYLKTFPLQNTIYGFYVRFKNTRFRLYYREINEIEIIFENMTKHGDNYYIEWHSYYIE
jgi:hypothetical protein